MGSRAAEDLREHGPRCASLSATETSVAASCMQNGASGGGSKKEGSHLLR
jgi:hypothetical protein